MPIKERLNPTPELPLFDKIPANLVSDEVEIRTKYDGSIGKCGVKMELDFRTGASLQARLFDLESGELTTIYRTLDRGHWCLERVELDAKPESRDYQKLEIIYESVLERWRIAKSNMRMGDRPRRVFIAEDEYKPETTSPVVKATPVVKAEKPQRKTTSINGNRDIEQDHSPSNMGVEETDRWAEAEIIRLLGEREFNADLEPYKRIRKLDLGDDEF